MSIELDPVLHVGEVAVAALAERTIRSWPMPAISVFGRKSPVAVLIRRDEVTAAFEVDGRAIAPEDFERRFPGLAAAFKRAAGVAPDG